MSEQNDIKKTGNCSNACISLVTRTSEKMNLAAQNRRKCPMRWRTDLLPVEAQTWSDWSDLKIQATTRLSSSVGNWSLLKDGMVLQ